MATRRPPGKSPFEIQERLAKASERLEKLGDGALVAFTAGAIVVGIVGGGVLWIPAAMGGALGAYRGVRFFMFGRQENAKDTWWKEYLRVGQAKQVLSEASLPYEEFEKLSAPLDTKLKQLQRSVEDERALLPAPGRDDI